MVATLLKLRLRLTFADLKRSTVRLVLWIVMGVYMLSMVALALIGLVAASFHIRGYETQTAALTVVIGSVVVLGWTLLPLVFFGSDQTLDPARFAQFPLSGRQLAPGLILSGVVGMPGLFTAILCLGAALPWLHNPVALVAGLAAGVLGFLMTQVGCRAATTALSGMLSTRKARDLMGLIGLVLVLVLSMAGYAVSLVITLVASGGGWAAVLAGSRTASAILGWTPLGSPWALAGDAAQGQWLMLAAHAGVTLAYLAAGTWAYSKLLDKALATPPAEGSTGVASKTDAIARAANASWAKALGAPVAAVAARCWRYWRRDPRYLGQIPAMLMMPVLFTLMAHFAPLMSANSDRPVSPIVGNGMIGFGLGFMALMAGYAMSADIAYDSTAWWMHLSSGMKGWQDRLGRVVGQASWAGALIVVVAVAVPLFVGSPGRIVTAVGACLVLYMVALGVSSVTSALIIYPVALPGESPLKMKTGMMGSQMLAQMGAMTVSGLLALPVCIWAVFAHGAQAWVLLLVAIVWGGVVLAAGIILGGKVMDARGPAILALLRKNDSSERT